MRPSVVILLAGPLGLFATVSQAATVHGQVYDDRNGDGHPSAGEPGVAGAVVAFDVSRFTTTDAHGQFTFELPDGADGNVWVRVPDGFTPGAVWAHATAAGDSPIDLGLRRLDERFAPGGPLTFVVAADTHIQRAQAYVGADELAQVMRDATLLEPPPAFVTILGDITQGGTDAEYDLVDDALDGLGIPYVRVPGNHDWYDGGAQWLRRYGPDNYSFDAGGVHFVVWNMAMSESDVRRYLGAELARVDRAMTIVALTHAPPPPAVTDALRELGVDYVLTGHAHSNRAVDHGGVIELNTEPLLMGGLDFTPAGYRVVTIQGKRLTSYHRTTVDAPYLALVGPAAGQCGGELIAAAELDAAQLHVTARVDCATPIDLRYAGGWTFHAALPPSLAPGPHTITLDATSASGATAQTTTTIEVCDVALPDVVAGAPTSWPQLGGNAAHTGAIDRVVAPPLVARWTATAGGHVLNAAPVVSGDLVFVATTDLGDGGAGGLVALEVATGAIRWRATTPVPLRGGAAIASGLVVIAQIDGVIRALDPATGVERWRVELSDGGDPRAGAVFAAPTADGPDVLIGSKRELVAIDAATGVPRWTLDPVPGAVEFQSLASIAVGDGLAFGVFQREFGGIQARERTTGALVWQLGDDLALGINASPVFADDTVFVALGRDEILALDPLTGSPRWRSRLDPTGFDWGNATVGTPAFAHGILVVPTLLGDVVALDGRSGAELWRHAAAPGPLRTTHYRGAHQAGFEASPVIAGDVAWVASTDGAVVALDLWTGDELWRTAVPPVLAGLAIAGDGIVVASYDGTVRVLAPGSAPPVITAPPSCSPDAASHAGCCDGGGGADSPIATVVAFFFAARARRRRAPPATR